MRKVYIIISGMDCEGSWPEKVFTSRKKAVTYIDKAHPDFDHSIDEYENEMWSQPKRGEYIEIIDMELE